MTVDELTIALARFPQDQEVFLRVEDDNEEPVFYLVEKVTTDLEGIMIRGGEEIDFEAPSDPESA